jgi:hypothetical protein
MQTSLIAARRYIEAADRAGILPTTDAQTPMLLTFLIATAIFVGRNLKQEALADDQSPLT